MTGKEDLRTGYAKCTINATLLMTGACACTQKLSKDSYLAPKALIICPCQPHKHTLTRRHKYLPWYHIRDVFKLASENKNIARLKQINDNIEVNLQKHLSSSSGSQVQALQRSLAALAKSSRVCPHRRDWPSRR